MPDSSDNIPILRCFAFRDQLAAIKYASVAWVTDDHRCEQIIQTIDYIDNVIRPRRNRLVHDRWAEVDLDGEVARRWPESVKIVKQQSHQRREFSFTPPETEDLESIENMAEEIGAHANYLMGLYLAVYFATQGEGAAQRAKWPEPPTRLPREEKPHPSGNE